MIAKTWCTVAMKTLRQEKSLRHQAGAVGAGWELNPEISGFDTPRIHLGRGNHRVTAAGSGSGLVGLAGAAGGAARFGGLVDGHLLQVVIAHEADEDAVLFVVSGDAGDPVSYTHLTLPTN